MLLSRTAPNGLTKKLICFIPTLGIIRPDLGKKKFFFEVHVFEAV
jgi:hypothetical protein